MPLVVRNHVHAHGDATSIELELTVDDPKLIPELQRRAAHELEVAGHTTRATKPSTAPPSTSQSEPTR